MARSLHFNASWLYQESAGIGTSTGTGSPAASVAPFKPASPAPRPVPPASAPTPAPVASDVAALAERAVVTELLQIAKTVLTLEITFEAGPRRTAEVPVPAGAALLDRPVVLRDGQVYGTLCCVSDDRRTPVGSRPADALRCVAVLVGRELDRHRRRQA
ncbi:hypothetical protein [Variovorax sp. PvP013]|uniref:hypothetical protein n=1 Tax=Variovorax sp. PvP013 TaxID=3156435 RepID=UPI003D1A3A28